MASLTIRVRDVRGRPLSERVRLTVLDGTRVVKEIRDAAGWAILRATELLDHHAYAVRVRSERYRIVARQVVTGAGETALDVSLPLHPKRAQPTFPQWDALPELHMDVAAYEAITDEERAGLLNVYGKMQALGMWIAVTKVREVRQDRVFAEVGSWLLPLVANSHLCKLVSGSLHESPLPEYQHPAGSWKTREAYGNLQLTFFRSDSGSLLLDADVDEAAGLEHVFQVVRNAATNGRTHPYDIHQLLAYQGVPLLYQLS